jgi:WD40 repeat protein
MALTTPRPKTGIIFLQAAALLAVAAGTAHADTPVARPTAEKAPAVNVPHTDRYGDPLPKGAIARLGTVRFRGAQGCLTFAPRGKLLATATGWGGEQVTLWDLATGRPVRRIPGLNSVARLAFSPDGKRLAVSDEFNCTVYDVASGKEMFRADGFHAVFSRAGKTLVTLDGSLLAQQLQVWDARTGKLLRRLPGRKEVHEMALADDGRTLALIDVWADPGEIQIRDLVTGGSMRSIRVSPSVSHWLIFAPKGKTLASASATALHLWDTTTGKEIRSWRWRLDSRPVFSPDGSLLAWTGQDEKAGVSRLWVVALNSATPRAVGAPVNNFASPCFSDDGKVLAVVTDGHAVQFRAVADGKEMGRLDAPDSPVTGVAFSGDGRHVISRTRTGLFVWETLTRRLGRRLGGLEDAEYVAALLPDGRLLTTDPRADPRRGIFRVRDGLTGQEVFHFEGRPDVGPPVIAVAPGSRYAAVHGRAGEVCVLDLRALRCSYRFAPEGSAFVLRLSADGDVLVWYRRMATGFDIYVHRHTTEKTVVIRGLPLEQRVGWWLVYDRHCVSPDGRWLVVPAQDGRLRRWDLSTGKQTSPLDGGQSTVSDISWSPDNRLVVTGGSAAKPGVVDREARQDTRFWDIATGRRMAHLDLAWHPDKMLFAHDGRTLLTTDPDGLVRLREMLTGKVRFHLRGHLPGGICAWALHENGRVLASSGRDSRVLVWDLTGRMPDGQWKLDRQPPEQLRAAWKALAGSDARAAYTALWQLAADPEGTTALLRQRLRPVDPPPNAGRLAKLVADLDSPRFAVRQQASQVLEGLAELAVPALLQARNGRLPLEAQRRVDLLLKKSQQPLVAGKRLQALRSVEVLERIGTLEARQLLETLAGGTAEARLTQEAKGSLERLARRAAGTP